MTYPEAEEYLLDIPRFTKKHTPDQTRCFYEYLGRPGEEKKIIHVAGTNGKGSVCAYLSSVLTSLDYHVMSFVSPHLITMQERMLYDGEKISRQEFLEAFLEVREAVERFNLEHVDADYHPTFFEFLFFMNMIVCAKTQADFVILETGLGGRLDATNTVANKCMTILTEIGKDHMQYLGNTYAKIAMEKAGIIRPGVPVVYTDKRKSVTKVIEEVAAAQKADAYSVKKSDIKYKKFGNKVIDFLCISDYYDYIDLTLSTVAKYQVENAALVFRALEVMGRRGDIDFSRADMKKRLQQGFFTACWEGRMEELAPDIYVDGAHNEDGIRAFIETVAGDGCVGKRYLLFSVVEDKAYDRMIKLLTGGDYFSSVSVYGMSGERAAKCQDIVNQFKTAGCDQVTGYDDLSEAIYTLKELMQPGDRIYMAGSLYLVGQIKAWFMENPDM